ncbi:MAG: IS1595 family transposase, partial [Kosmotogaceae bacterium]
MEKKFESLSIFEFQGRFPDDDACLSYLADIKWSNGFVCPKCGHNHYCKATKKHSRQCTKCNHIVSPTSGTLFHKVKFPILKAFYIVYYVSTTKKGISSTELSRKLSLRQKTCWLFKQKVMKAMQSSGNFKMQGKVEVDETVVGGQEEGVVGRKNKKKKLVVFAIERKGKGIQRLYGKVISNASSKELGGFMKSNIATDANIKTDEWTGYKPLRKNFPNLSQTPSGKKGEGFPDLHRAIMGFKGWLRGMHHHAEHLQAYIDEYTYRFNRNFMTTGIFENLINRMMDSKPVTYNM